MRIVRVQAKTVNYYTVLNKVRWYIFTVLYLKLYRGVPTALPFNKLKEVRTNKDELWRYFIEMKYNSKIKQSEIHSLPNFRFQILILVNKLGGLIHFRIRIANPNLHI